MQPALVSFIAGVLLAQAAPWVPGHAGRLAAFAACLVGLGLRSPRLAAFLFGASWSLWHAGLALDARLPAALDDEAVVARGTVASLPVGDAHQRRFDFELEALAQGVREVIGPRRIAVSVPGDFTAPPGGQCELHLRVRQPRGAVNPGGFDLERWLLATGIDATARLITHPGNRCSPAAPWSLLALRDRLARAVSSAVPDPATAGILAALAVGARAGLTDHQWQVLRDTGTTHMVSISGLHVSMVALAVAWLAGALAACERPGRWRVPAPYLGLASGWLAAAVYTLLAGATTPTLRSLLMLGCLFLRRCQGHALLDPDGLRVAAALVLLLDPLACLTASAWLTFGSVWMLGLVTGLVAGGPRPWRWARVHLWLALVLAPLVALVVPTVAWTSALANALVVPWVTWVVVPLNLLGTLATLLAPSLGLVPWQLAAQAWEILWAALERLAQAWPASWLPRAPGGVTAAVMVAALLLILVPLGKLRHVLGAGLLAASLYLPPQRPGPQAFRLTVLDVGQGQALVVETARHVLVFDPGPRSFGGRDAGEDVVLPYLRRQGWRRLDRLVTSHADIDHAGGQRAVLAGLPVDVLVTSPADPGAGVAERCGAGTGWRWDDVSFRFLSPLPGAPGTASDNEQSCVLEVDAGGRRALLTADLEGRAEERLVAAGSLLPVEVLLAPHHGSASSSGPGFVAAVRPRFVAFSRGHRNRFGMPAPTVAQRYRAAGATLLDTADDGALTLEVGPDGTVVQRARHDASGYWRVRNAARLPQSGGLW